METINVDGIRKIQIFIGSSLSEFAEDRKELVRFISAINNEYIDKGIYFEPYVCEEESSRMAVSGSQSVYNQYIENDADIAVFMFFKKAGQYTLEEMEIAHKKFLEAGHPNMLVYFKVVDSEIPDLEEIRCCTNLVASEYGLYYKLFEKTDTIKLELLDHLIRLLDDGSTLIISDGKVLINSIPLSDDLIDTDSIFAYQNNTDLKELREEKDKLLLQMQEASEREDADEALSISIRLDEVKNQCRALESDILYVLRSFSERNREGKKADPVLMEALRLVELGETGKAAQLLPHEHPETQVECIRSK